MSTSLEVQVAELQLLKSSLLSDETLTFLDEEELWTHLTVEYDADPTSDSTSFEQPESSSRFRIDIEHSGVSIVVGFPKNYDGKLTLGDIRSTFAVKGDQITRAEQERWKNVLEQQFQEIEDTEFPIYQLLSLHLLPLLHEKVENQPPTDQTIVKMERPREVQSTYHALLTSHHLISPNKRRSLQSWSASLSLSGFAKVGYPGVIYAYGQRDNVEEFVGNVKAMQWLALKVRLVEELPGNLPRDLEVKYKRWLEFQKVGEVVEEMRRLGREQYILEMGIGSAAKECQ